MFFMRLMENLTLYVFLLSSSMSILFYYESCCPFWMFLCNIILVVKFMVYCEYFSSNLRSYSRLSVTCDLFYPVDIDR